MTVIRYIQNKNIYKLEVDGHSDFAKSGQDIVCSAASAITYSLISALEMQKSAGKIDKLCVNYGVAHINISFICPDDDFADTLLCASICGYKLLSENYPSNVKFVDGFSI